MSVQNEIDRIEAARDDIAEAIREQGVSVPAGTKLGGLGSLVRAIVGKVLTVAGISPDSSGNVKLKPLRISRMSGAGGASQSTYDGSAEASITITTYSAATASNNGLMSAADKGRLDGIRVWPLNTIVPDAWTQDTDGSYYSRRSAPGMTPDTQIIACTLMARYVGDTAAEQAAATWTYLETDDDDVVLHAPTRPAATFGLVIAALPT